MKISKILFISFFTLLAAVLLLFTIPADEESVKESDENSEWVNREVDVPAFNHLVVENGCNVKLKNGKRESSYFSFNEHVDSVPSVPGFEMHGDTLVVTSTRRHSANTMTLFATPSESYVVRGTLDLQLNQATVVAHVDNGQLIVKNDVNTELQVFANNGRIEHYGKSVVKVNAHLVNSKLRIHKSYIEEAIIKAESNSEIMLKRPAHLEMERDRSCKYYERD